MHHTYLALSLLVLAGAVAEAGKDGGDGLGVVETARKYDLIAVVLLTSPLFPPFFMHGTPSKNDVRDSTNHASNSRFSTLGVGQ